MKITIESTEEICEMNGLPVRLWTGMTEGGQPCVLFIAALAANANTDLEQFEKELVDRVVVQVASDALPN